MDSIQRLNYFTSQFLVEDDFQDEQTYHREMRHRHNRSLHTPGVVEGLMVSKAGDRQIKVSAGMAINRKGQEMILLTESGAISLSGSNTDVFVTIQYGETVEVPDTTSGLANQFRRVQEKPEIAFSTSKPSAEGPLILLASVKLDTNGNIVGDPKNQVRTFSGAANALNFSATHSITLTPDETNHRLEIGENHSARTDNPHGVTAQQIGALSVSGGTVTGELAVEGNIIAKSIVAEPNSTIKTTSETFSFTIAENGKFQPIPDLEASINTHGNPVMITANFSYSSGGTASNQARFTILRSTDSQLPINLAGAGSNGPNGVQNVLMPGAANVPVTIMWIDTPPAGKHKYSIAGMQMLPQKPLVGSFATKAQIAVVELN
jgi:hypothetical protein